MRDAILASFLKVRQRERRWVKTDIIEKTRGDRGDGKGRCRSRYPDSGRQRPLPCPTRATQAARAQRPQAH